MMHIYPFSYVIPYIHLGWFPFRRQHQAIHGVWVSINFLFQTTYWRIETCAIITLSLSLITCLVGCQCIRLFTTFYIYFQVLILRLSRYILLEQVLFTKPLSINYVWKLVCHESMDFLYISLAGSPEVAFQNICSAVNQGVNNQALGVLICDWSGKGHVTDTLFSLAPLVAGAGVAWNKSLNVVNSLSIIPCYICEGCELMVDLFLGNYKKCCDASHRHIYAVWSSWCDGQCADGSW